MLSVGKIDENVSRILIRGGVPAMVKLSSYIIVLHSLQVITTNGNTFFIQIDSFT